MFVANSADTLAVFAPLLTESEPLAAIGLACSFLLSAGVLLQLALSSRRLPLAQRLGPKVKPWVLIGVGLYVLANTTTDLV